MTEHSLPELDACRISRPETAKQQDGFGDLIRMAGLVREVQKRDQAHDLPGSATATVKSLSRTSLMISMECALV